ncbi:MAG: hypothetical protein K2J37_05905 [Ruminococcus sp.]|nr:hypothetical protein [Ruminococcus sp.]MDE6785130.1 hypothetical protein [Ruminococcus sp.]
MNTYKSTDRTQLTTHFNLSEFKCKCGGTHDTYLDLTLANKLEQLHKALNCSKIIINSGYRCAFHDRNVGGNGSGMHTQGLAADIVCYDKDEKRISSKIVSCAAQDIGFGGIANIDSTYTATHVDTRTSNFWKGDEVITLSYSICTDFYSYYKLSKEDVYGADTQKKTKEITIIIDGVTYIGTVSEKEN